MLANLFATFARIYKFWNKHQRSCFTCIKYDGYLYEEISKWLKQPYLGNSSIKHFYLSNAEILVRNILHPHKPQDFLQVPLIVSATSTLQFSVNQGR